jgi:hypothetical protein
MGLAAIYGHQIRHQFPCHGQVVSSRGTIFNLTAHY